MIGAAWRVLVRLHDRAVLALAARADRQVRGHGDYDDEDFDGYLRVPPKDPWVLVRVVHQVAGVVQDLVLGHRDTPAISSAVPQTSASAKRKVRQ